MAVGRSGNGGHPVMANRRRRPNGRWPVWMYVFMLLAGMAAVLSLFLLLVGGVRNQ